MKEKRIFDGPGINFEMLNDCYKIKTRHLKNDLIAIQQKYLGKPNTEMNVKNMYEEMVSHFKYFSLDEFKFRLIIDNENHKITFEPVGEISKIALRGIMSLE